MASGASRTATRTSPCRT
uniref:Uncharacterized protein n=1 Tax=Arundo donax TaxID=35708 RepID=A0A0A9QAR6_ARUDO